MAKKKLGNKYVCYQCGCKFYDLSRPQPICPKCGANQDEGPKKIPSAPPRARVAAVAAPRSRPRRRRGSDDSLEPVLPSSADPLSTPSSLEDGLSLIDDEDLIGTGRRAPLEED